MSRSDRLPAPTLPPRSRSSRVTRHPTVDPVLAITSPPPPAPEPEPEVEPRTKLGFYVSVTDAGHIRACFDELRREHGYKTLSDFIAAAVLARVAALEVEHHDGRPFDPLAPGSIGTGRPLR